MAGNYTSVGTVSLLDGVNFSTLHAQVESATGFLDLPERKASLSFSWPDEHGLDIDLGQVRLAERKCSLSLIVKGSTYNDLASNVKAFLNALNTTGYHYLKLCGVDGIFLVYTSGLISVSRLNRGISITQLVRITVPLIEPYSVKRMFFANEITADLDITTSLPVTVDWGDRQYSSLNTSGSLSHTYDTIGEYCICIYGGVQGITDITSSNSEEITGISGGGSGSPGGSGGETPTADSATVTADDTTITADAT